MKRIVLAILASLLVINCPAAFAQPSNQNSIAADLYNTLMEAQTYAALNQVLEKSRELTLIEQENLLAYCLTGLKNPEEVPFENDIGEAGHDLSLVRGRSAWLISKMLNVELPIMDANVSKEKISEAKEMTLNAIWEKREETLPSMAELAERPLEKRLEMARSPDTREGILSMLAKDEDARVRRAVAANENTHPSVVTRLGLQDENPAVRETAREKLTQDKIPEFYYKSLDE